jgi:hypothetical protein
MSVFGHELPRVQRAVWQKDPPSGHEAGLKRAEKGALHSVCRQLGLEECHHGGVEFAMERRAVEALGIVADLRHQDR